MTPWIIILGIAVIVVVFSIVGDQGLDREVIYVEVPRRRTSGCALIGAFLLGMLVVFVLLMIMSQTS